MNLKFQLFLFIFFGLLLSCKKISQNVSNPIEALQLENPDPAHNSRNSINWAGYYAGILPCADCEGIKTTIHIHEDMTYFITKEYLGKGDGVVYKENGTFVWNDKGSHIILNDDKGEKRQYKVGENMLFHLDNKGNRIDGDLASKYILMKVVE